MGGAADDSSPRIYNRAPRPKSSRREHYLAWRPRLDPLNSHSGPLNRDGVRFRKSTHADAGAYLVALSLFSDLGLQGTGTLSYDGSYSGSISTGSDATGSYEANVTGEFAGLTLDATLSATRAGIPGDTGDPVYTVKSTWQAFLDLNKPPIRTYEDSGTITVNKDGTAAIDISLVEKTLGTMANLTGNGLTARVETIDGIKSVTISGPTKTTKPFTVNSQAVFLINETSMKFSSSIFSQSFGVSIIDNGGITAVQNAGLIGGDTAFTVDIISVAEPPTLHLGLTVLAAIGLLQAKRRQTERKSATGPPCMG